MSRPRYSYSRIDTPTSAAFATAVAALEAPGAQDGRGLVTVALGWDGRALLPPCWPRSSLIEPGQVRLSVGVNDPGALLADLRQALDAT